MNEGPAPDGRTTVTIDVRPIWGGSETGGLEAALARRPGVGEVVVNPVAQTATITFDPRESSAEDLGRWGTEGGYHCAGRSVPAHVCDPALAPVGRDHSQPSEGSGPGIAPAPLHAGHAEPVKRTPDEVMGHGGHGDMSMAEMVTEMRNRFMLVVSHEFRTPLSIILTSSEMLDRYYDRLEPDRRKERLSIIRSQVQHLRAMLDEISIVVRSELGRLEYHPADAEVVEFVRQVAGEMGATVGLLHQISVSAEPNILYAQVDITLLRHVLTNLLSNAIKFSETQADIQVRVYLDRQHHPPSIAFEVTDQGIGIEQSDLDHLFEPFFRGRNVGAVSGTGLGLKVVKDCLTRHGGSIAVTSASSAGSTFIACIPYHPVLQPEMAFGSGAS